MTNEALTPNSPKFPHLILETRSTRPSAASGSPPAPRRTRLPQARKTESSRRPGTPKKTRTSHSTGRSAPAASPTTRILPRSETPAGVASTITMARIPTSIVPTPSITIPTRVTTSMPAAKAMERAGPPDSPRPSPAASEATDRVWPNMTPTGQTGPVVEPTAGTTVTTIRSPELPRTSQSRIASGGHGNHTVTPVTPTATPGPVSLIRLSDSSGLLERTPGSTGALRCMQRATRDSRTPARRPNTAVGTS